MSPQLPERCRGVAFAAFCSLFLLLVACGISLSEDSPETELFKKLTIVGDFTPGSELTLGLDYEQIYPVPVDVQCDLLSAAKPTATPEPTEDPRGTPTPTPVRIPAPIPTPGNRIAIIFEEAIGPNPEGSTVDESTPVLGSFSRKFTAPQQRGRYRVRCYTPADRNNQIFKTIEIKPA